MRLLSFFAALAMPASAGAAAPTVVAITLSSFKFAPSTIRLHHGQHYQLRLTNSGGGGHDFVAPEFFAAAKVAGGSVSGGEVDVDGHASVTIDLIAPPPGRYRVHCSHFMHSTFGMKGEIVVD